MESKKGKYDDVQEDGENNIKVKLKLKIRLKQN